MLIAHAEAALLQHGVRRDRAALWVDEALKLCPEHLDGLMLKVRVLRAKVASERVLVYYSWTWS